MIYAYSLDVNDPCIAPNLLATSKQINAEGMKVLHKLSTFTVRIEERVAHTNITIDRRPTFQLDDTGPDFLRSRSHYPPCLRTIKHMRIEINFLPYTNGHSPIFHQLCILALLTEGTSGLALEIVANGSYDALLPLNFFGANVTITRTGWNALNPLTPAEQAHMDIFWHDYRALIRADDDVRALMQAKVEAGVTSRGGVGTMPMYTVARSTRAMAPYILAREVETRYATPAVFLLNLDTLLKQAHERLKAATVEKAKEE